jgi:hypothetical protein
MNSIAIFIYISRISVWVYKFTGYRNGLIPHSLRSVSIYFCDHTIFGNPNSALGLELLLQLDEAPA